jgi:hypothetical protein
MPRFYLHVCNGNGFTEDSEGQDLPDVEAARALAITSARDIMADEMRGGMLNPASFIEVEDAERKLLFTVHFSDAYTVNLPGS